MSEHIDIDNKCNRCGINPRYQEHECCEPCLNEMLLGHPANHHKWNQFVLTLTDALINRDRR